jgi:hypothetical protein
VITWNYNFYFVTPNRAECKNVIAILKGLQSRKLINQLYEKRRNLLICSCIIEGMQSVPPSDLILMVYSIRWSTICLDRQESRYDSQLCWLLSSDCETTKAAESTSSIFGAGTSVGWILYYYFCLPPLIQTKYCIFTTFKLYACNGSQYDNMINWTPMEWST